jgi:two-component system, sensor histidine kinase and response regulator
MMNDINILVVDDFTQNLIATEALLGRPGLRVLKAGSGDEALELLLQNEVALALIDVQMPGMDGYELAEILRGNPRTSGIPLIFMTAAAQERTRAFRGYQAGAVDFLNKPINPDILRGKVEVFAQLFAQKKQIQQRMEELRDALQMNELFISVLGHDLRTPLSAVMNGAELIQHLGKDDKVNDIACRIFSSAERMENMVSQLLDVAKIRSGGIALTKAHADLREVGERIVGEMEQVAPDCDIRLRCVGETQGFFDPDRMAQIVSNLVSNAVQHGDGGCPVEICVDGTDGERVCVRVRNQGVMPPHMLENVFKPYYSAGEKPGSRSGLGLGLYIVKEFVTAHKGSVSVESSTENGTVFEVALPREAELTS